jgi:hypothetical protein
MRTKVQISLIGLWCLFICPLLADFPEKPRCCLVIGGGPAGLATAIEAKPYFDEVIVFEKREAYTREQRVYLNRYSLDLLNEWDVGVEEVELVHFEDYGDYGFVAIKRLEEGLRQAVERLGIPVLNAEFHDFGAGLAAQISQGDSVSEIPYTLLVGADGVKSEVRGRLGIDCSCLGSAIGTWTLVPHTRGMAEVSDIKAKDHHFLRKITTEEASLVLMQSFFSSGGGDISDLLTKEELTSELRQYGWDLEATLIENGEAIMSDPIPICL